MNEAVPKSRDRNVLVIELCSASSGWRHIDIKKDISLNALRYNNQYDGDQDYINVISYK